MSNHVEMGYMGNKDGAKEDLLVSDLNKLNEMKQPQLVLDQLSMLLDDLNNVVCSLCSKGGGFQGDIFPAADVSKCGYCSRDRTVLNFTGGNLFANLFVNPLNLKTDEQSPVCRRKSTSEEGQDLCEKLDDVHLKNGQERLLTLIQTESEPGDNTTTMTLHGQQTETPSICPGSIMSVEKTSTQEAIILKIKKKKSLHTLKKAQDSTISEQRTILNNTINDACINQSKVIDDTQSKYKD
ncbi:unnamed protein product [Mytilus coruscus]|uniref:Uncharacterized protein n=1 Tax=Mytilus coruscus TaxID=42192 RepID=A0A6J8CDI4_MYTCO|nr:unnamed protein product [Mytilus coruscus]